jgi:hypothetical protein
MRFEWTEPSVGGPEGGFLPFAAAREVDCNASRGGIDTEAMGRGAGCKPDYSTARDIYLLRSTEISGALGGIESSLVE